VNLRPVVFVLLSVLAAASLLPGSDLSRYREFQLGMPLADAAKQAGIESSEAKLISSRPERIEGLDWRTDRSASAVVKEMAFDSGYNSTVRAKARLLNKPGFRP